ncbi:MAG TPA: hypothetical protein VNA30_07245 [Mycobacteriales bacterium]|nr:hypothetical protein [Mycobacteriales bacterium]
MSRLRSLVLAAAVVSLAASVLQVASAQEAVDAAGMRAIGRTPYNGGTELAYDGKRYLYAGSYDGITSRGSKRGTGGIRVFDTSGKGGARQIAFIACPGNDNDVEIVRPGLLAVGWHTNSCGQGHGLRLYDVRNPAKPRPLGLVGGLPSAHTISVHPDRRHIYVSPGGTANGAGKSTIIDTLDPMKPKAVGTLTPNPLGCHDTSFSTAKGRTLAICAGAGEVQIWDVKDPLKPVTIAHIANPLIQFPHYAMASPDGDVLIINDEAFAAHGCVAGASPHGALSFYDIKDPTKPIPLGRFAPRRGASPAGDESRGTPSWCTSHQFNLVPGTRRLVLAWFTGGTSVIDYSDPLLPVEFAHYRPDDANTYSAHYFGGRVYANDKIRGLETLEVEGITSKAKPAFSPIPLVPAPPKLRLSDLSTLSRGPVQRTGEGPQLFCRR